MQGKLLVVHLSKAGWTAAL